MASDASGAESGIFLALHEHVHVHLANINAILVALEAVQERLVEAVARVLLSGLLVSGLSILNWCLHGSLLHRGLLLLNGCLTVA